ncbi:YqhR family membrane protein [Salsuginibacillus kocurii]|uniref:YqhR family membrane protein n=1 Tax=Salsuginibacillus kocurii TaxID=427078 RepID=UPI000379C2B0|nr:YqhR family membrane protein [Salsuginibacillus kocurii]
MSENTKANELPLVGYMIVTAIFAGVMLYCMWWIANFFLFVDVSPSSILPVRATFFNDEIVPFLTVVYFIIASFLLIVLAYFTTRKVIEVWPGLIVGFVLWSVFFLWLNAWFPEIKPVAALQPTTIVTSLSLFLIYGIFINYSMAYEWAIRKQDQSR